MCRGLLQKGREAMLTEKHAWFHHLPMCSWKHMYRQRIAGFQTDMARDPHPDHLLIMCMTMSKQMEPTRRRFHMDM